MESVKRIPFNGMVRATSALNNQDGNCEEVINLRQDMDVWRTVGKKEALLEGVDYEQVYVHKYGVFENYIGVKAGRVVWFAALEDGKAVAKNLEICRMDGEVVLNSLTNILLVRNDDRIVRAAFTDTYRASAMEMPDVPLIQTELRPNNYQPDPYTHLDFIYTQMAALENAKDTLKGVLGRQKAADTEYTEGYVFVCATYRLFDGSETKPTPPILVKLGEFVPGVLESQGAQWDSDGDDQMIIDVRAANMKLQKLKVKVSSPVTAAQKEVITRIHVYATPAFSHYDLDTISVMPDKVARVVIEVKEAKLTKKKLEQMLFYRVAEVEPLNPPDEFQTVKFDNGFTANPTMQVDTSGWVSTVGRMFVYNNRLHLYDIRQKFLKESHFLNNYLGNPAGNSTLALVCRLRSDQGDTVIRCDVPAVEESAGRYRLSPFLAFPDSRCCEIEVYHPTRACIPVAINMAASATYNFAFNYVEGAARIVELRGLTSAPANIPGETEMVNNNKILVSEVCNPQYFPPEHSYQMPGEILSLAVNTEQISASQVGMYPLYVFTAEGVYALQMGDGKVLYSNVVPISAEVAVKGSRVLQTRYGIVFVTEGGLKIISGAVVDDLSEPLRGLPDRAVREGGEYGFYTDHPLLYNIRPCLSSVAFTEYIRAAGMGYDITRDEIIISNPEYAYSYVYSLKTKTWHKITERFTAFDRHVALRRGMKEVPARAATVEIGFRGRPAGGDEVGVQIGARKFTYVVREGENAAMVRARLRSKIGEVYRVAGSVFLVVTLEPGEAGNHTAVVPISSAGFTVECELIPTGADARLEPALDVCDIRGEEPCNLPVHLQTRPMSMDFYGFKTITRAVLRGEIYPAGKRYGTYLFASDDLLRWKMVSAAQVMGYMTGIPMQRTGKSFRYFMLLTGGEVEPQHTIACLEVEGGGRWDGRMR